MKFARWTYLIAGIYGLLVLIPQYFLEEKNGRDFPPAINHPEYYYGFIGVAVAWQVAFLIISSDPQRYRLLMIASVIEKYSYGRGHSVLARSSGDGSIRGKNNRHNIGGLISDRLQEVGVLRFKKFSNRLTFKKERYFL